MDPQNPSDQNQPVIPAQDQPIPVPSDTGQTPEPSDPGQAWTPTAPSAAASGQSVQSPTTAGTCTNCGGPTDTNENCPNCNPPVGGPAGGQ